jgi:RNA-binding protein
LSDSKVGLAGFQKKYLRGVAHGLRPLVHVGKGGLTEPMLAAVDEQLNVHELIKVRFLDPEDKKAMAKDLAAAVQAEIAGIVGHVAILYRASQEAGDRIRLPTRQERDG